MFSIRNTFYCRLVELEKLRLRTRKDEEKVFNDLNGVDPFLVIRLVIIFNKTCLSLAKKKLLKSPVYLCTVYIHNLQFLKWQTRLLSGG